MSTLFPVQVPSRGGAQGPNNEILNVKAGKVLIGNSAGANGKFTCTADTRKGSISLVLQDDILHFQWKDRTRGTKEDDRMIFPGDATFKKVNTGRANDRVYVLKYSSGSSLMFWMQDKNAEKDEEICTKINTYINDLTAAHAALTTNASATSTAPAIGGLAAGMGRVNTPGGVNADQWMQIMGLGGATPSSTGTMPIPPSAQGMNTGGIDFSSLLGINGSIPPPPPTTSNLTAEDLHRALRGVSSTTTSSSSSSSAVPSNPPTRQRPLSLQALFTTDSIISSGVLEDPAVRAQLVEHLPESQRSDEFLEESIRSPQFIQALSSLSSALQSENFDNVMASFQLDPSAGLLHLMSGDAVRAFLAGIEAQVEAEERESAQGGRMDDEGNNGGESKE